VSLVVDASVLVKWFVAEELTAEADRLRPLVASLVAPDFCLIELTNILWKKVQRGTLLPGEAAAIVPCLRLGSMRFLPSEPLLKAALDLAYELQHPVYDCLYLASMELLGIRFVTWDRQLHARLTPTRFARSTYLLSEVDRLLGDLGPAS
jgi:predicted nucleic acid-binding protein